MSEQHWWLSVAPYDWWLPVSRANDPIVPRRVERFETMEQALLHAAATGGFVPFQGFPHGVITPDARRLYDEYLQLSEQTK